MKKNASLLVAMLFLVASCSDSDDNKVIPPAEIQLELEQDGVAVTTPISVTATSKISLTAKTNFDEEVASYEWTLNGELISQENDKTFDLEGRSGTLSVAVELEDKRTKALEIELTGPYKQGTYLYGTTNTSLSFVTDELEQTPEDNLYAKINGKYAGDGGINDIQIFNNKIYFLSPRSENDKGLITIADAQTLKELATVNLEENEKGDKLAGDIYNLLVVNEEKAYIGRNGSGNAKGFSIAIYDLKNKKLLADAIEGTTGVAGKTAPGWARMKLIGENAWVAAGDKVLVIDTKTDKVIQTLPIAEGKQAIDVVTTSDETKVYVMVGGVNEGNAWMPNYTSAASILVYSVTDFNKISETSLEEEGEMLQLKGGLGSSFTVGSPLEDELYFTVKPSGYSSSNQYIYCFKGSDKSFKQIIDNPDASSINGYMGVNSKGQLLIGYSGQYSYTNEDNVVYDVKTGKLIKTLDAIDGEMNAISTALFN